MSDDCCGCEADQSSWDIPENQTKNLHGVLQQQTRCKFHKEAIFALQIAIKSAAIYVWHEDYYKTYTINTQVTCDSGMLTETADFAD